MDSTKVSYDYRIGSIFVCRTGFKRIHAIGNIRLSRIQTRIEKDPTFYSKEYYARAIGPIIKISISWMHDLFCKHGESLRDRETIDIRDNFSRKEIYNLYKEFVQEAKGNNCFMRYAYFTRLWKIEFNNVHIPR